VHLQYFYQIKADKFCIFNSLANFFNRKSPPHIFGRSTSMSNFIPILNEFTDATN